MFAEHYLQKHSLFKAAIEPEPLPNLGIVVALPCYNEPCLIDSLESLWNCSRPRCSTEVIVLVNSAENSPSAALLQNEKTILDTQNWIKNHFDPGFRFFVLHYPDLPAKKAGVGLARKIAMDEAVYRFQKVANSNGIILCFDADATCDTNYFCTVEDFFRQKPETTAASIYFEHPLQGQGFDPLVLEGIAQYELHLRYFLQAQRYAGFPFAFHTVGSSMCVKASVYCKQGGMNQKQAGEDFYLLQKIIPLGSFGEINLTRVMPSPRVSEKVPFGTGASMQKFVDSGAQPIMTYNPESFEHLKMFFATIRGMYKVQKDIILANIQEQHAPLRGYLLENKAVEAIMECNEHSASVEKFLLRFYNWFNAFRIIRFLNISHSGYYSYVPAVMAAARLLEMKNLMLPDINPVDLLHYYRKLDRGF